MKSKLPDSETHRIKEIIHAEMGILIDSDTAKRLYSAFSSVTTNKKWNPVTDIALQQVTVILADLRGFSAISEAYPPEVIFEILNLYLTRMSQIAIAHGGTIDKFMGDAIMLLFGAPSQCHDDVRRAVACAIQMQIAMDEINQDLSAKNLPTLYMGAGINTGIVTAGIIGSNLHSEYTVIGNEVNIASRIEAFSLRGQVLISEATYDLCEGYIETSPPMEVFVKGKTKPVQLREVLSIPSIGLTIPRREIRNSPRVKTRLPLTYQTITNKIIQNTQHAGIAVDISYHGLLADMTSNADLEPYSDILITLDLSLLGTPKTCIQGKIKSLRSSSEQIFAGIEFTSLDRETEQTIRRFVQLLIQGSSMT